MIVIAALKALTQLVNRYLRLDATSQTRLQALSNKAVFIEIQGLGLSFYLVVHPQQLEFTQTHQPTTTQVCGTPLALLRFLNTRQAAPLVSNQTLTLHGDLHFLQELQRLFSDLNIDWEEYASHWLGDIAAYKIFQTGRDLRDWRQTTTAQLRQNISEYVQEELRYFPPRAELEDFYQAVDQLRDDSERLIARITRLANNIGSATHQGDHHAQ